MKKSTGSVVRMSGEKMEVLLEAGCVTRCAANVAAKLPQIMHRLCRTLARREIAKYFINDIRIGETVGLVDKMNGYAFRFRMEAHTIRVLEIHENNNRPADSANTVYLVNWGALRSVSGGKAVAA